MKIARVDENQGEIVDALRSVGAFVQSLASVGAGCPDLLVCFRRVWYVMEVKNPKRSAYAQRLTAAEVEWHQAAKRHGPVHVVRTPEEAMQIIGAVS